MKLVLGYKVLPVPQHKIAGVYFLLKYSRVVYVGQSTDVFARIRSHGAAKSHTGGVARRNWTQAVFIPTFKASGKARHAVERYFIRKLRPRHNSTGLRGTNHKRLIVRPSGLVSATIHFSAREARKIRTFADADTRGFTEMVKRLTLKALGLR